MISYFAVNPSVADLFLTPVETKSLRLSRNSFAYVRPPLVHNVLRSTYVSHGGKRKKFGPSNFTLPWTDFAR